MSEEVVSIHTLKEWQEDRRAQIEDLLTSSGEDSDLPPSVARLRRAKAEQAVKDRQAAEYEKAIEAEMERIQEADSAE